MLKFENVSKTYHDGTQAVKSMNFEIQQGEFIVFIGPSGCGKTTTMKMINRLIPHTEGTISIKGRDINQENLVELRRNIGYVIQQGGLFPHYTIEENISLVPQLKGWKAAKRKERAQELMQMVGLEPSKFAARYPRELSGGQQQRVGVARALAADPEIVLMDEPFGALDPITREQLQDELIRLQKTLNKTIVFVTHDMDEALKLADRIAVMKDGVLLQLDTPEKLLREPEHGFVETFIGKNRIFRNPEFISIQEIMRENPATATPSLSPARALSLMRQRRTDTLLVGDEEGKLIGIVSAYDLQAHMNDIYSIQEICVPVDPFLEQSATAQDALIAITNAKFGIIPVIGERKKIVGVVTRSSLLTAFADQWAGKKVET
ncbi:ABC transporter ATP-binding protein [Paenibacillus sediminis]|uniref:Quaternary amine transport ATP-binding protein n=1 Tax=Paenibacillus sediminis TaxID=664909 RepID=A0ABS4H2T7_9BACL|nr:ABC transporter ATP-binding protein [Paenibacillus sediminis]MBP1936830.1 osmoprotectant transport system ATP-binding protein [Paenibacillus sediminis]